MLGLTDHPPVTRPTLPSLVRELLEHASGLSRLLEQPLRFVQLFPQNPEQTPVFRQSEEVIHAVGFAPPHQFFPAEAAVSANHDLDARPDLADRHDPRQMFHGPR